MRRTVLAVAMVGGGSGGLGCVSSGDDGGSALLCTQQIPGPGFSPEAGLRFSTRLDPSGVPLVKWTWDATGLVSEERYVYDELGRLAEIQHDSPPLDPDEPAPPSRVTPDGRLDAITTISYFGGMADLSSTDLRTQESRRLGVYVFDGEGRPTTIEKELGITDEVRVYQYDAAGRVRIADERGLPGFPRTRLTEYVFTGEWPSSMRAIVDGAVFDWQFVHAVSPGRVHLHGSMSGMFEEDIVYEHDAHGRLTAARRALFPEKDLEITYAADGAVEILVGGSYLHTYSAGCGVRLEVPHGLPAPRGLMPARYTVPEIPHPYVMPSLNPF